MVDHCLSNWPGLGSNPGHRLVSFESLLEGLSIEPICVFLSCSIAELLTHQYFCLRQYCTVFFTVFRISPSLSLSLSIYLSLYSTLFLCLVLESVSSSEPCLTEHQIISLTVSPLCNCHCLDKLYLKPQYDHLCVYVCILTGIPWFPLTTEGTPLF